MNQIIDSSIQSKVIFFLANTPTVATLHSTLGVLKRFKGKKNSFCATMLLSRAPGNVKDVNEDFSTWFFGNSFRLT